MWPYWSMFGLAAMGLLMPARPQGWSAGYWYIVVAWCALLIGVRHEVGADWGAYLNYFERMGEMTFMEALEMDDPAYYGLNWIVGRLDGDIYVLNAICGVIVMTGVSIFSMQQRLPWLALVTSIPYLVIVVSMGYARQGAALGLVLLGLHALASERTRAFVLWVLAGALFHKSAVLVLPIAAVATTKRRAWTFFWVAMTAALGAYLLVSAKSEQLWTSYVEEQMQSEGGMIRVAMNAMAAAVFLVAGRRMRLDLPAQRLWWWMSVFAAGCIPVVQLASTAVDRVALYFIPLQVFCFSNVPLVAELQGTRHLLSLSVLGYYGCVLWVWMNYASHAEYWVPYQWIF